MIPPAMQVVYGWLEERTSAGWRVEVALYSYKGQGIVALVSAAAGDGRHSEICCVGSWETPHKAMNELGWLSARVERVARICGDLRPRPAVERKLARHHFKGVTP